MWRVSGGWVDIVMVASVEGASLLIRASQGTDWDQFSGRWGPSCTVSGPIAAERLILFPFFKAHSKENYVDMRWAQGVGNSNLAKI